MPSFFSSTTTSTNFCADGRYFTFQVDPMEYISYSLLIKRLRERFQKGSQYFTYIKKIIDIEVDNKTFHLFDEFNFQRDNKLRCGYGDIIIDGEFYKKIYFSYQINDKLVIKQLVSSFNELVKGIKK